MTLAFAFLIFVFAAGICTILVSLARAPLGYEDEKGFHTMRPIKQVSLSAAQTSASLRELAGRA